MATNSELFFTYPNSEKFKKTIVKYNQHDNDYQLIKSSLINTFTTRAIQIGSEVISSEYDSEEIVKYWNLFDGKSVKRTVIGSLGQKLENHSLTNLRKEKIFFSGGFQYAQDPATDRVIAFDLKKYKKKEMPRMNKARCNHSSLVHQEKLYVISGQTKFQGEPVASMEVLDLLQPDRWVLIHEGDPLLYRAEGSLVSLFSPHEMIIAGGDVDGYMTSDVIIYDFRNESLT